LGEVERRRQRKITVAMRSVVALPPSHLRRPSKAVYPTSVKKKDRFHMDHGEFSHNDGPRLVPGLAIRVVFFFPFLPVLRFYQFSAFGLSRSL
jgi:hypothetical protein